ncbi:MAG: hypothetical protein FWC54_00775 [Actinomycetia bacterium]|nr:hypothetical protein [Actinomycetes bacterium]
MKKIIATTLATMMLLSSVAAPAFAAGGSIAPSTSYTDIQGDSAQNAVIPVYGYVGEDAAITDTDPGNPATPPTVTPYEINVSVPVKIIWAAFQTGGGVVTAPNYSIKNNSANNDLDVTLTSFTARSSSANTAVDSNLVLNIVGTQMAQTDVVGYTGSTPYSAVLGKSATWNFTLGGMYSGAYGADYNPAYDMTLTFALATP